MIQKSIRAKFNNITPSVINILWTSVTELLTVLVGKKKCQLDYKYLKDCPVDSFYYWILNS